jgi:flagellar protein FlaI
LLRLFSPRSGKRRTGYSLETLPFDAPHQGRVVSNYLVNYELQSAGGVPYKCSFTVYIYESSARWFYLVKEPYLDPRLREAVSRSLESLTTWLAPSPLVDLDPIGYLAAEMKASGAGLGPGDTSSAGHYLARDILGYWLLDPLIRDPQIEDISCEGVGRPVKVWHRQFNSHGWLETNVSFSDHERMNAIVARLVHRSGRSISSFSPIVDAVLPEGFRLAATWGREVTSLGSSFTIRKQRSDPFTIVQLIRSQTIDAQAAAYLWMLLDMKGFVVISGVTASGKTTLLNSLATVLNPAWKIISIEDTREISLSHSGWKPLQTRSVQGGGSVTLFDLVRFSLRERPDFVILGEARGEEVQALFQCAASGSGCITTFHSPNTESMVARLTQPPLSVSPSLLSLIDAAVFMVRSHDSGRREVSEIVEAGEAPFTIFRRTENGWEGELGVSRRVQERARAFGFTTNRLEAELDRRLAFLERCVGSGVSSYTDLSKELRKFYASSSFTL